MKILFVVATPLEINTSASIRNRATILGLIENGHEVTLVTTLPDKKNKRYTDLPDVFKKMTSRFLKPPKKNIIFSHVQNIKIPVFFKKKFNRINNHNKKSKIYPSHLQFSTRFSEIKINDDSYDLVISSSDPKSSHLFVYNLYINDIMHNTPWLQIWGDPFLGDITHGNKSIATEIENEEKKLLKFPTKVMYVSKFTLRQQQKFYNEYSEKMFWLPVPYEREKKYPVGDLLKEKELIFLYAGDYLSNVRDIEPLYNSFLNSGHKLIICGSSDISLKSKKNIEIYPRVSGDIVDELISKSDILIHLSNKNGTQIPAKVYHYSATNKPILFILDGEIQEIHELFKSYSRFVFTENNTKSINRTIENFYDLNSLVYNNPLKEFQSKRLTEIMIQQIFNSEYS